MPEIKFLKWTNGNEDGEFQHIGGMWGGIEPHHKWKDYIEMFSEEVIPYLEELRRVMVEGGLRTTGEHHQYHGWFPLFSDNTIIELSYRAWGDLMAAIWNEEGEANGYMDFYM
jgi:hypothetical protein